MVTKDTVIPDLPKGEEILKDPNEDVFNQKMRDLDKKAIELKEKVEEAKLKRKQVYEGGKIEGGNTTYRDLIIANIDEVKKVRSERKDYLEKLTALRDQQRALDEKK